MLKKPTTMSVTLKVPAAKQGACEREVDAESVPHVRAYTRVKGFLKLMLRDIIESANHNLDTSNPCHRLVKQLGPNRVVSEFRQQLLAFARREWPFTDPISQGDTLTWWESLRQHPHARVLAVSEYLRFCKYCEIQRSLQMLAIKIFSVLVNSMPDERTGSKITWFNSPLRANQDVSTLVNMIQVGQWYGVHKVRCKVIHNIDMLTFLHIIVTEGWPERKVSSHCQISRHREGYLASGAPLGNIWLSTTAAS